MSEGSVIERTRMTASARARKTRQATDDQAAPDDGGGNPGAVSNRGALRAGAHGDTYIGASNVENDHLGASNKSSIESIGGVRNRVQKDTDELVFSDEDDGGVDHGGKRIIENGAATRYGEIPSQRRPCCLDLPRPDMAGLSDVEKKSALGRWKRAKNRLSVQRYRAEKRAIQAHQEVELDGGFPLRPLHEIGDTPNGGAAALVSIRRRFNTKSEVMHTMREVSEYYGIPIQFYLNNSFEVRARPHSTEQNVSVNCIDTHAKYIRKDAVWRIVASLVGDERGSDPEQGARRTSYRIEDLARHVEFVVKKTPDATAEEIIKHFRGVVKFPGSFHGNEIARIRRMASVNVYGSPNENCMYLPVLKAKLEMDGHVMQYSTISGPQMRSIILGVARDNHARARRTAVLKPVCSRTAKHELAIRRWTDGEKTAWVEKHFDLLDSVSVGGKRYVDAIFVMFSSTIATKDRILSLFNVDACVGKVFLDSYTLYLVIGFTSNFNIVPVAYCWICANESISSWTRVFEFIKSCLPDFSTSATIASDRDKGIAGAISTVFSEQIPHQMLCVIYRKKNLARYGKKAVDVYDRMVYAPILDALESIKRSAQFSCLNEGARVAITEHYEDSVQFLSACVSAGGVTYGRTSSQAVESQNFHIKDARALDLFNSVLWIAEFEAERYAKWGRKSAATNCHLPPKIRDMLHEAKPKVNIGEVSSVPSQSSDDLRVFIVQTAPRRRHTISLFVKCDQEGNVLSYIGTCSCGQPQVDRFPCRHMYTVSLARNLDVKKLVPPELTTAAWKDQYPVDHKFVVPSRDEILGCESLAHLVDPSLGLPVTAPTRPGHPRKNRVRSVMEKSIRRKMTRNDNR